MSSDLIMLHKKISRLKSEENQFDFDFFCGLLRNSTYVVLVSLHAAEPISVRKLLLTAELFMFFAIFVYENHRCRSIEFSRQK